MPCDAGSAAGTNDHARQWSATSSTRALAVRLALHLDAALTATAGVDVGRTSAVLERRVLLRLDRGPLGSELAVPVSVPPPGRPRTGTRSRCTWSRHGRAEAAHEAAGSEVPLAPE